MPDDALPWLLATANHILSNSRRADRRRTALSERLAGERQQMPSPPIRPVLDDAVRAALLGLDPGDRELLLLVAWEELAPSQAARVLGISAVAARVRLHRLRRRLARELKDRSPEASLAATRPNRKEAMNDAES